VAYLSFSVSEFGSQSSITDTVRPKITKFEVISARGATLDRETALFRFKVEGKVFFADESYYCTRKEQNKPYDEESEQPDERAPRIFTEGAYSFEGSPKRNFLRAS
jgi:hypothetical protein